MNSTQNTLPDIFTRQQAAEYLYVCRTTLDRLGIPRIQIRRRVLFKKQDIEKWLDQQVQPKRAVAQHDNALGFQGGQNE
jgi:excisionase family DNA binding protein